MYCENNSDIVHLVGIKFINPDSRLERIGGNGVINPMIKDQCPIKVHNPHKHYVSSFPVPRNL